MAHRETRRRWQSTMVTVDDILIEIVLRLPTKLQVQLKTVCQRWRSSHLQPQFLFAPHSFIGRMLFIGIMG